MSSPGIAKLETTTEPAVKILLVDDHPENLLALEALLEGPGHELVLADSGAEALRKLLHSDFGVIILDVMMPGMDGFETAALIRQRERSQNTPIIFLTALGRNEEALFRGYDAGAVDYLVKPVAPAVLKSKVAVFVQLKRQTEMLAAKNIELNAMVQELEAFSYTVAHDLRAPLARMEGFSQALLESQNGLLDEEGKRRLNRIGESSRQMCQLVDDLLGLSRVTRTEVRRELVDLSAMAQSITLELQQRDPAREVEFVIESGVIASGDAALLHAAMSNLLENAWKFTGKHARARIEFGEMEQAGTRVYFVRDDGAGFDMASSKRLFQAFHRLHKTSEFQGSGIGLATVARIVKRHGGRLRAESAVEQGATFYFSLTPDNMSQGG